MHIKQIGEESYHLEPKTDEEMMLAQMLFKKITEVMPDEKMGDRTDLAMAMFVVVKDWAHRVETVREIKE